jgi:Gas vesicle synthesis protein GvpL/GvpF
MLWVYAIADHPELPPPRRRGLAQAPLQAVVAPDLAAVVTQHEHAPSEPAPDALWTHERVVERLMVDRAVLPMRFGTMMAGGDALRAVLEQRHDELLAALAHVRGRVELGVRAVATGNGGAVVEGPPATGRDYLQVKLGRSRTADAVHEPLARIAVEARRHPNRGTNEVLRAAYLVERGDMARFRSVVDRLAAARTDVALLCTGPWPPYAFITAPAHEPVAR